MARWKPFSAYAYQGLFLQMAFGLFFSISVKEKLAYWGLGFEIFRKPNGIAFFVGPLMFAVGSLKGEQN